MSDSPPRPVQIVPFGSTHRPETHAIVPPPEVRSYPDLPSRFFIGDIDPTTFSRDGGGWRVRYVSSLPDTFATLRYRSGNLEIDARWRGAPFAHLSLAGRDWHEVPQTLSLAFQAWTWDDVESDLVRKQFNAHYLSSAVSTDLPNEDEALPVLFGMPDGIMKTIAVPIPVDGLRRAMACMRAIDADPEVATTVSAYALLGISVVNYITGRCPGLPQKDVALARYFMSQFGSPVALPVREGRRHYTFLLNCTFRDLEHIIRHLFEHGLIGAAPQGGPPERYPEAPEYAALVMPAGAEMLLEEQSWWDPAQTRRMFYPQILQQDQLPRVLESAQAGPDEVSRAVEGAEAWRDSVVPPLFASFEQQPQ